MWEYLGLAGVCLLVGYYAGWIVRGKWELNKNKFVKTHNEVKKNKQG